jgi:cytoskeleton protein RodZ
MESLGATFKHARESRKLSLSQVAEATRISWRHLQTIEEGRYSDLPGGMYNRAFIRAYSEFLGLDSQSLITRYDVEVSHLVEKKPARKQVTVPQNSPKHRLNPILAWSVMLGLSTVGVFMSRHWIEEVFSPYFSRPPAAKVEPAPPPALPKAITPGPSVTTAPPASGTSAQETPVQGKPESPAVPPAPPQAIPRSTTAPTGGVAGPPAGSPAASGSTSTPAAQQADAGATPETASEKKIRIHLVTLQKCWTSVTADANRIIARELEPGEERNVSAVQSITIVLGNAGGVKLTINGQPAKALGRPGDVVKVTITEQNLNEFLEPSATRP